MKEKKYIPEEPSKKLSDAKKNLDDIMKRIEPFLPEKTRVIHKQYSEWKSSLAFLAKQSRRNLVLGQPRT